MPMKFSRRAALISAGVVGVAGPIVGATSALAENDGELGTRDLKLPLIGPVKGDDIHVMSYNIRVGTDRDKGERNWSKRRDKILRTIKAEKPDIIGLQEALLFQVRYLNRHLPGYRAVYRGREKDGTGETTGILYRDDRLELLNHTFKWMSTTPNEPGSTSWGAKHPRITTFAKFRDRETGHRFVHINCHFDHASAKARRKSARYVRQWIRDHDHRKIVTGDFNAAPGERPYDILVSGGMHDTWNHESKRVTRSCGTANLWRRKPRWNGRRIDWILGSGGMGVTKVGINHWVARDGHVSSDHWPVQALMRFK